MDSVRETVVGGWLGLLVDDQNDGYARSLAEDRSKLKGKTLQEGGVSLDNGQRYFFRYDEPQLWQS